MYFLSKMEHIGRRSCSIIKNQKPAYLKTESKATPTLIHQIETDNESRIVTKNNELNRVLGEG